MSVCHLHPQLPHTGFILVPCALLCVSQSSSRLCGVSLCYFSSRLTQERLIHEEEMTQINQKLAGCGTTCCG